MMRIEDAEEIVQDDSEVGKRLELKVFILGYSSSSNGEINHFW